MALKPPQIDVSGLDAMISSSLGNARNMFSAARSSLAQMGAEQAQQAALSQQVGNIGAAQPQTQQGAGPAQAGPPGNDEWAQAGFAPNVPRSLFGTESGGNWLAKNDLPASGGTGHHGILQFSPGRLSEAIAAGVIGQMTPEQFRQSKPAQVAASNWHFNDIDARIAKAGLDKFNGQTVGGAPITQNGLRAMAHLGGFGGMSRYLRSGGSYNPADAYGTSLKKYAITHQGY